MSETIVYSGNVSRGGESSVNVIQIFSSVMEIRFKDPSNKRATYKYKRSEIGRTHFNNMKLLANQGKGLNSYLHEHRIKGVKQ